MEATYAGVCISGHVAYYYTVYIDVILLALKPTKRLAHANYRIPNCCADNDWAGLANFHLPFKNYVAYYHFL